MTGSKKILLATRQPGHPWLLPEPLDERAAADLPRAPDLMLGGLLAAIGAFGLLRLPEFFARLHPPTMGATLGVGCLLIASMLVSPGTASRPVILEVLITVFVVMTAPVTAMLLARALSVEAPKRER